MNDFPSISRACVLCPRKLTEQLHMYLDLAELPAYTELRLQAAVRCTQQHRSPELEQQLLPALQLLDLQASLFYCSPAEALQAWERLDRSAGAPGAARDSFARERYAGAIMLLCSGLAPWLRERLLLLRRLALATDQPERELCRALLLDALLVRDRSLADLACHRLGNLVSLPTDEFDHQLCVLVRELINGTAQPWMLDRLLAACRSYGEWQRLNGLIWDRAILAGIVRRASWKLHLQAHERCHARINARLSAVEFD